MTNPNTYPVVKDVYQGVAGMFADEYMHLGGDELAYSCLNEVPAIKQWCVKNFQDNYSHYWALFLVRMLDHNMSIADYDDLVRYYRYNLTSYVTDVNKKMVVWQEAYEEMENQVDNPLQPNNTIVQVWINKNSSGALENIIKDGFKALVSAGWYLDQQVPSVTGDLHYLFQDTFVQSCNLFNNQTEYWIALFAVGLTFTRWSLPLELMELPSNWNLF